MSLKAIGLILDDRFITDAHRHQVAKQAFNVNNAVLRACLKK
jgi:hypothetical protein